MFHPILRIMLNRSKWEILNIALIAIAIWSSATGFFGGRIQQKLPKAYQIFSTNAAGI
jgi:hypothetical protein